MKRLIWIGSFTYLLIGLTHIILGSILTEILDYYDRSYTEGGILIASQSVGFLAGVISASYLSRLIGRRRTLIFSFISIALAQIMFMALVPWEFWFFIAILAGFGFGIIEPLVGALIIDAINDKPAIAFSRLEVFFGLGSLIMPIISGWLASTDLWRYSFLVLGLYAVVIGIVWMKTSFGSLETYMGKVSQPKTKDQLEFSTKHRIILIMFMIFFIVYVGLEISVMNFLPSILVNQVEAATFLATLSVTIFWGAMVAGRLFAGHLAEWMQYARYLIICCTGTVVFIAILGMATSLWLSYLLIVLIGLMMAGIFGIAIVYATTLLPGSTDKITSILIASGGAGGIFFPLIAGSLMDHATTTTVAFVLAGLSILMIVIILFARNHQKQQV